jgi:lipopolysaccharide heptosyltransferase II
MMNRTIILKVIDRAIGKHLVSSVKKVKISRRKNPPEIRKVLFIRPGGIGDAVLLIPAILALKNKYPDSVIDVLAEKRNHDVFSFCTAISKIYLYDKPDQLLSAIRSDYDVVIDTEQWYRLSAVIARLTGAAVLTGYATNERKTLFTHPISYSQDDHEIDSFMHLLFPVIGEEVLEVKPPFISIPDRISEHVKAHIRPLTGKKIVAIFPGGSIREKRWGSDKFHDTAKLLVQKGYGIVVLGGKEDVSDAIEITWNLPFVVNLCGELILEESAAVLKEASLLITTDSGIMHIASALGTRILALFGPSNPMKWAPRSEDSIVITKQLMCSPCSKFGNTPRCKYNNACMQQITVNEVYEKAIRLLER